MQLGNQSPHDIFLIKNPCSIPHKVQAISSLPNIAKSVSLRGMVMDACRGDAHLYQSAGFTTPHDMFLVKNFRNRINDNKEKVAKLKLKLASFLQYIC